MGLFDAPTQRPSSIRDQNRFTKEGLRTLQRERTNALGDIGAGVDAAEPEYRGAAGLFDAIVGDRSQAQDMYYNALGLNGQGGYDAALGAFQQGPGYQFALDEANKNVMRNAASLGSLRSGNTMQALSDRAQNLQNLQWDSWLNRLQGQDPLSAITGKAGALQDLGSLFANEGINKAGVRTSMAPHIAGQWNNRAALSGQQDMMRMQAQAQQNNMNLGLLGLPVSMFNAYYGA